MSRGQSTQTFNTATSQNATNNSNAQASDAATQGDIGDYQNQLAKFVSGNPYTAGGEYDQTINAGLANTSDAGSNSLKGALQSQAMRTGQNSAADAATAASSAQQNTRDLSSSLASAQQQRISDEAGYNQQALSATATPASLEAGLAGQEQGAANSNLSTAEGASQTPSFWDTVGNGIAGGLGKALGSTSATAGPVKICWIAAELYDGWYDQRTMLVREWLTTDFSSHTFGRIVVAAYVRYGERTARLIRKYPVLRRIFLPIFNAALARAEAQ